MERELDLILIGGGPAASAAAITAADAGLRVAMISRAARHIDPVDEPLQSTHPGLETLLTSFGAEKAIAYASRSTYQGIFSGGVFTPLSTVQGETWSGHHISRMAFDAYLAFCSRKKNIDVFDADEITALAPGQVTLRSGRRLSSRYLIDASGRSRIVGKKLRLSENYYSPPLTSWSGVAEELPESVAGDLTTSFIPESFGWTWLAPHPPASCTWTRLAGTKHTSLDHPEVLSKAARHSAVVSANVRWRKFNRVVHKNILLTGDAAGIVDPGAGQGIFRACWSGIIAAQAIVGIVNSDKSERIALRTYEDWFTDNYENTTSHLRSYYQNMGIIF